MVRTALELEEFYCTLLKPTSTSVPKSGDLSFSVTPIKLIRDIKNLGTGLTQRNKLKLTLSVILG
jgi:hypothetical protein